MSVAAPAAPQPTRFGLFSAATVLDAVDPHELTGVEYEAVCSTRVDPWPAPCQGNLGVARIKEPHGTTSVTTATPFAVYAADECVLGRDSTTAQRQLRQRFLAGEEAAVEYVVETGVMGNIPNLQGRNPTAGLEPADELHVITVDDGAEVDIPTAVGLLEQWLADTTGGLGVLHAPRASAPKLFKTVELVVSGARAATRLGSTLVFGTGYSGEAPRGQDDDGSLWLYATAPVTVRRSELIEPADLGSGAFSKQENVGNLIAERLYVVDWPCGVAAVKTSVPRAGKRIARLASLAQVRR